MFVATVMALLCHVGVAADQYRLEWKLREGETFYAVTDLKMTQNMEIMGNPVEQTVKARAVIRFRIKSVTSKETVAEMTYLLQKFEGEGVPLPDLGKELEKFTFIATLDKDYNVTKLEGYEKFLEALAQGDPMMANFMRLVLPEPAVRQSIGQTFAVVPNRPISIGDNYERKDKMVLGPLGTAETLMEYKLDKVDDQKAYLSIKGSLKLTPGKGEAAGLPFKISDIKLKSEKFNGQMIFDMQAGRLAETRAQLTLNMSMAVDVGGQKLELQMQQKMDSVTRITNNNPLKD